MNIIEFTFLVWAGSLVAGFLGSLTGLGGGVVLVPLLTIFFHVDLRYAIGASLVSVIATSSGSAAAYVKEGFSNIRIGMFLEIATTVGAIVGAYLAALVSTSTIAIIFGAVLLYSAVLSWKPRGPSAEEQKPDKLGTLLKMNGSFPTPDGYPDTAAPWLGTLLWRWNFAVEFGAHRPGDVDENHDAARPQPRRAQAERRTDPSARLSGQGT